MRNQQARVLRFYGEPPTGWHDREVLGRIVVFEGPDGAGRSTHIRLIKEWLEDMGLPAVDTGLTRSDLAGRGIDRAKTGHRLDPVTLNLFYATDFCDRLERVILPSARAGMVVLADRTLGRVSPETRAVWDGLRTELNMGQYMDVVGGARGSATADEARRIIEHKTARYTVVRPLQLGAALAGRPDLAEPLERHGRPVGMAFQLRDDILGAFGDPAATGKPVGDDLLEGKPTLLMAMARAAAAPSQLALLDLVGSEMSDETVADVQQVIIDTGALANLENEISELLEEALGALEALPDVHAAKEALATAARFVALRQA